MYIYHGSKVIIKKPIPKGSNPYNDYGASFYTTLDLDSAKSWACKSDALGYVNKYFLSTKKFDSFKILDLTDKSKYSILNWVAILIHFKQLDEKFKQRHTEALKWLSKYYIDVYEYDVVIGYRADDAYFSFPTRFIANMIALEDLEKIYLLGDLGIQYAFMSKRAVGSLKFVDAEMCDESFTGHYQKIVNQATIAFHKLISAPQDLSKTYILDLIRKDNE